jgi:flagellar protein FliO/FliZ
VGADLYTRLVLALAVVVALLAMLAWAARRFGFAGKGLGRNGRRLAIVEVAAVDAKRRLVLVRRDDTEHLVLIGGDSAVVIERGIAAPRPLPAPSFATALEEGAS